MTFQEPENYTKIIKNIIEEEISKKKIGVSVWQVTDIQKRETDGYISDYRCQIKKLNFKYTLDNVQIAGIGLGNAKGILKYPNINDFVLVAFSDEEPYIIGTIYDTFAEPFDNVPQIKLNELAIIQKEKGSIILMQENNDVIIRASDNNGNFDNGAKIRVNSNGSIKLLNKEGYGFYCDSNGDVTISSPNPVNYTTTPINW